MNEIICMVIIAIVLLIMMPITWLILNKLPDLVNDVVGTIKWNLRHWNDYHDM